MSTRGSSKASILVVGFVVVIALVAVGLILGAPTSLDPESLQGQFAVVLGVNALMILAPFLYAASRASDDSELALDVGSVSLLGVAATVSLLGSGALWFGLGFRGFVILHILAGGLLALTWLGWIRMQPTARDTVQRHRVVASRRGAIHNTLTDIEIKASTLSEPQASEVRRAIVTLQEEVRLLTPTQLDQSPGLMQKVWAVVDGLSASISGLADAKPLTQAMAEVKAIAESLKRSTV